MKSECVINTAIRLNKTTVRDNCSSIDICDCYEPIEALSEEQENEWCGYEPKPTLENTSFYVTEPDGTRYFYCGNTRTKVTEFFPPNGKTFDALIENVVRFAAGKNMSA